MRKLSLTFFCFLLVVPSALAHSPLSGEASERWAGWLSVSLLLGFWLLYTLGHRRLPAKLWRTWCFHATTVLAAVTLIGPLDDWAETSTAAHMVQHMLIMVVIAPLWVLSRPLPQVMAALRQQGAVLMQPLLALTQRPLVTAYLHGVAIWFWHLPTFYTLAVDNAWWHVVEHACFLVTAGLFWWAVLRSSGQRHAWALLAVLFTLMHTGFLGALLTFAREPLYGDARSLADQQLAGLIMWVVASVPYLGAAAWVGVRWMRQLQRQMSAY